MVASMFVALPATAAADSPEEGIKRRGDHYCQRVPEITRRVEEALARINGDADTRGSLAWMEDLKERAEANGRDRSADMIGQRIAIRTERIDVLELRREFLADAAEICADRPEARHLRHRHPRQI
jgi:hypothetical protein